MGDAVLRGYGAEMVDKDGNITVKSDARTRCSIGSELVPVLPPQLLG